MLQVTVSGSFHRHMDAVTSAVQEFTDLGVRVVSPADPRVVDQRGDFLFVASDRVRSIRMVQDRHLEAIRQSDFLWLVTPDGYVGQSASMEIGFAAAVGTPVLGISKPADLTLRRYVESVSSLAEGVRRFGLQGKEPRRDRKPGFLIDPAYALQHAHDQLQMVETMMRQPAACIDDSTTSRIAVHRARVADLMA